jgi:hypothetical protein
VSGQITLRRASVSILAKSCDKLKGVLVTSGPNLAPVLPKSCDNL